MSQPASIVEPRPGEVVLSCRHPHREWRQKPYYVGYSDPLKDSGGGPGGGGGDTYIKHPGIGALIRRRDGSQFYVRWVVLCWSCRLWRWLGWSDPLIWAAKEMVWTGEDGAGNPQV